MFRDFHERLSSEARVEIPERSFSMFVYADTETTGFSSRDKVVEISLVDGSGKVLFESLVNPGMRIPAAARRVHGISDDMVRHAPSWKDIEDRLVSLVRGRELVGHNISYDLRFTGAKFKSAPARVSCTLKIARKVLGRSVKLDELAKLSGHVPAGKAHRATADCLATRTGHLWLLSRMGIDGATGSHATRDPRCRTVDAALCPPATLAGKPWGSDDDALLLSLWNSGTEIPAIMSSIPRSPRALFARLERLGAVKPADNPYPLG